MRGVFLGVEGLDAILTALTTSLKINNQQYDQAEKEKREMREF